MQTVTSPSDTRVYSIDVLRGAVMILMALDHVRDYFHIGSFTYNDPGHFETISTSLFFTRWITHFCAPAFVFLAGISAFLMGQRKTKKELSAFLIKRGVWLLFVEIAIVSFAWTFDPLYHVLILQVIWAIGISMIILGLTIWLPLNTILFTGLGIICFHNLLDYPELSRQGHVGIFWEFLHHGRFKAIPVYPNHVALVVYAFLPWTGIMLLGYGMGRLFTGLYMPAVRRKILLRTGTVSLLLFVILRTLNQYGDPVPWYRPLIPSHEWLSFLNVNKYPPSLDYILLTLGVAMVALGLLDRISKKSFSFIRVFGRVPFFYYILHLYILHSFVLALFYMQGYSAGDILPQHSPFLFRPDLLGFTLPGVYLMWMLLILVLYPVCKAYDGYKRLHKHWWLSYL